ncbi:unnamed protein product [Blepharisma stoltei]|uniref:Protein TIC 214 n=1 Tax=Blepharisma stoltei TaxID=1481888 RepID=A0AAU9K037_9CILI|nr:unnamed protein product [Blepharisma stoltei]
MEAEIKEMLYEVLESEISDIQTFINKKKQLDDSLRNLFTNSPHLLESIRNYIEDLFYDKRIEDFDADNYAKYIDCLLNGENPLSPELNPNFGDRFNEYLKENIEKYQIFQNEEIKRVTRVITWNMLGEREEFPFESSTDNTTTFEISSLNSNESLEAEVLSPQKFNRAVIKFAEFLENRRNERIKKGLGKIKKANLKVDKYRNSAEKYREITFKYLVMIVKRKEVLKTLQVMAKNKTIEDRNQERNYFKNCRARNYFIWWAFKLELKKMRMMRIKLGASLIEAKFRNNQNIQVYRSFYVQKNENREFKYQALSKVNYGILLICKWESLKKWSNKFISFGKLKTTIMWEKIEEKEYFQNKKLLICKIIKVVQKIQKIIERKNQSESFLLIRIYAMQKSNEIVESFYTENEKGIIKKQNVRNGAEKLNIKCNLMIKLAFDRLKNYSLNEKSNYEKLYAINLLNIINFLKNYQSSLIVHAFLRLKLNSMAEENEISTQNLLKSQSHKIWARKISQSQLRLEKSVASNVLKQWKNNILYTKLSKISKTCVSKDELKAARIVFSAFFKTIKISFLRWKEVNEIIKIREFGARKIGISITILMRKRLDYSYWHIQYWNDLKKWSLIRKLTKKIKENIQKIEKLRGKQVLNFDNTNLLRYRIKEYALSYDKKLALFNYKLRDANAYIFQANEKLLSLRAQNAALHNKYIIVIAKNKQESEKMKKLQLKFSQISDDKLKIKENITIIKKDIGDCEFHIQNIRKNIGIAEQKLRKKSVITREIKIQPFLYSYRKLFVSSPRHLNSNPLPKKHKNYEEDIKILNKSSIIATILLVFLLYLLII